MALSGKLGLLVAGIGAAHFAFPEAFEDVTQVAFPDDTGRWVLRNGATEVAIGSLLMVPPTRRLARVALLGYVGWLGHRVAAARD